MSKRDKSQPDTHNARAREAAAEWVETSSLKPWDRNPRKNDENVKRVMESIKRFGFAAPIVARAADRTIIAGHTRWKAAQALKLDQVPVRFLDLDPADAHLLALADNRLNELSPWDEAELQRLLGEYGLEDVALAGWSSEDLDKMAGELAGDEPATDDSDKAAVGFAVLIECANEDEQLAVIEASERMGWKCRALI